MVPGDATTEDISFYEEVFDAWPPQQGSVLDIGCAWGRMFPLFLGRGLRASGVDISRQMIADAEDAWKGYRGIGSVHHAVAENLPFDEFAFDNVVCVATFDATNQEEALAEMLRVTRPGGQIYLTGKHTSYPPDDNLALEAEVAARRKGHPNFFTDARFLAEQLEDQGHRLIGQMFFTYRGDFSGKRFVTGWPDRFYEFFFVIQRGKKTSNFAQFSFEYSETYGEIGLS